MCNVELGVNGDVVASDMEDAVRRVVVGLLVVTLEVKPRHLLTTV